MIGFLVNKLTDRVTQITDPANVFCFLVQGTDAAVLIDTGTGLKGLRKLVEELTDLPVSVVLTHGHGDHAGGVGEWPKVYLHPADRRMIGEHGMEMRMGYAAAMMGPDANLTEEMFVPVPGADTEIAELSDGQIFPLGGAQLEVVQVPGHTRGSCCMLLRGERSILYGDACNVNTLVSGEESTTISEYKRSLLRLKTFDDAYDTVYYSHGAPVGPRQCLEDNIELCDRILAGTDDAVPDNFLGRTAFRAAKMDEQYRRLDGKFGNIVYSERTKK